MDQPGDVHRSNPGKENSRNRGPKASKCLAGNILQHGQGTMITEVGAMGRLKGWAEPKHVGLAGVGTELDVIPGTTES